MERSRNIICIVCGLILLTVTIASAEIKYRKRFNADTGRGDWVVDIENSTICQESGAHCPDGVAPVDSLGGLSDVGTSTPTAGNLLIANGSSWNSTSLSGDCSLTGAGVIDCTGVTSLTGLSDVGSATVTSGRLLVADGTKFQSIAMSGDASITGSGVVNISSIDNLLTATDFKDATQSLGSPTYSTYNDFFNSVVSTGRKTGGEITDAGSSQIAVAAGTGFIKATDDDNAQVMFFNWSAPSNITIPANTTRYIGVDYNSGSPQVVSHTSYDWDWDTNFPLGRVINDTINGSSELYIVNTPWWVTDGTTNIFQSLRSFGLIRRDSFIGGLELSVTGTRNVSVSAGTLWAGVNDFSFSGINTAVTGHVEGYWYKAGTGWQEADLTQYSVTQWNDITQTTLQTISANRYATIWVYGEITDSTMSVALLYPQAQHTSAAAAEAEAAPSTVPTHITNGGLLLGRIIIKQSTDAPVATQSAFTTAFTNTVVSSHNNLSSIQGGSAGEYYHLTASEYSGMVTSLTGLSDVGSATQGAGRILISDGTDFQSAVVSGDVTITSSGVATVVNNAVSLGELSDVGSATATAGNLLVADGSSFQGVTMSGDTAITSAGIVTIQAQKRGWGMDQPSSTLDVGKTIFVPSVPITISGMECISLEGTSTVVKLTDGTNDMTSVTCGTALTGQTFSSNNTFSANEPVKFTVTTVNGSVTYFYGQFTYQRTP